jgi:hypothetical protein
MFAGFRPEKLCIRLPSHLQPKFLISIVSESKQIVLQLCAHLSWRLFITVPRRNSDSRRMCLFNPLFFGYKGVFGIRWHLLLSSLCDRGIYSWDSVLSGIYSEPTICRAICHHGQRSSRNHVCPVVFFSQLLALMNYRFVWHSHGYMFTGFAINVLLYGITLTQTYFYFTTYARLLSQSLRLILVLTWLQR